MAVYRETPLYHRENIPPTLFTLNDSNHYSLPPSSLPSGILRTPGATFSHAVHGYLLLQQVAFSANLLVRFFAHFFCF